MHREELLSRFVLNLPEVEWKDDNRFLYHVLQAQWFNERFNASQGRACKKPRKGISSDADALLKFGRWLMGGNQGRFHFTHRQLCDFFRNYYYRIPVCGAIIYRTAERKEWLTVSTPYGRRLGFPKGKVNYQESDVDCACREVMEETGLNIRPLLHIDRFIEFTHHNRTVKFFIIVLHHEPSPSTMRSENSMEISACQWVPVSGTPLNAYVVDSREAVIRLLR